MDMNFQGVGMGKLVGPAGGGGAGGGGAGGGAGGGVSTQFRVLPNSKSSECKSVEADKVLVASPRGALHLKLSAPVAPPHRTFSPDPLKKGDEYVNAVSSSPLGGMTAGFRIDGGSNGGFRPSLTGLLSGSLPSMEFPGGAGDALLGEDVLEMDERENLVLME